ncbi:Glyoxalase/bleomycin resistance protein/dioxygenase [Paenibacillus curdlanolyticus YK9]|uniref:Glyoxalase/bleomycin resistance protein/dioxygenase n=1 Tax=Paenibacillus curdlanolyticus YK9 TaxID=717606 RepID=E0IGL9_9BACL|nr:VOC family protein [Paenibacillus curdlanolyticus]EFM08381.1 Glyoxalase/bleomycin resistance protein/dioxygenase [Paenibacillus curdlanolyticus YK9]
MGVQLTPYLMSEDARAQAEFYKQSLGGEIQSVTTFGQTPGTPEAIKDKVMHMVLTVAGSNTLFLSDAFEPEAGNRSISLSLAYTSESEARAVYNSLGEGGVFKYPFDLQPWGAYYGEVVDQFGVTWQIIKP